MSPSSDQIGASSTPNSGGAGPVGAFAGIFVSGVDTVSVLDQSKGNAPATTSDAFGSGGSAAADLGHMDPDTDPLIATPSAGEIDPSGPRPGVRGGAGRRSVAVILGLVLDAQRLLLTSTRELSSPVHAKGCARDGR